MEQTEKKCKAAHKSVFVRDVVGELQLVERDRFAHPLLAGRWRVRVYVHALGHLRVGLAGDQPTRVLELVAAVVDSSDVHRQDVLASTFQAGHLHLEWRKHTPVQTTSCDKYVKLAVIPTKSLDGGPILNETFKQTYKL